MSRPNTHPGFLHAISRQASIATKSPLVAFSHNPHNAVQKHTLIFLGGLFDGLLTVPYTPALATRLTRDWRVVEPLLGSCYRQWGISNLNEDVLEIIDLVEYFKSIGDKVVLMGHSTGCQQIMQYLLAAANAVGKASRPPKVDGAVMQASVSDREAMAIMFLEDEFGDVCKIAQEYVAEGRGNDVLPNSVTERASIGCAPVTAERYLSLASPGPEHAGEDDFFSSDLSDERLRRTFGRLGKAGARLAFLYGEKDQFVPETVDKVGLVKRWTKHVENGGGVVDDSSGILYGASHNVKEGGRVVEGLAERVRSFLSRV